MKTSYAPKNSSGPASVNRWAQVQSVPPQERGAFIRENRLDADGLWRTKIDIPSNQVVVVLKNGTAQAEIAAAALSGPKALPEAAGGKAARLEFFDDEEPAVRQTPASGCVWPSDNDCVPLRGSIETNHSCTLGFPVRLADGAPGILTAEHCWIDRVESRLNVDVMLAP